MATFHVGNTTSSRPPSDNEPISLLHVDDQVDFVEMAAQFLEGEHDRFTVETATSASAGLEKLSRRNFDCIVSDYRMPGKDGLAFLEAVREEYPDLPFILFTGEGSEAVASEAISKGVTDYLQKKPGSDQFTVLANRVENAVHQARAERRLEESQRRFQTLLSNIPGMAYRCQNERGWPMLFVSDGCAELTGYDPSELVEGDVSYGGDIVHPDDRGRVWESVQEALQSREPFRIEYRIRTADDKEKWVWEQGRGVFDDGDVVALEGFITDVTERTEAQAQLEYQSSLLEAQMETTIDGLLVVDENRTVVSYNDRFVEMWGIPADIAETDSDEALLDWIVDHRLADPAEFLDLVEALYDHPEETSRDEIRLTDGRVFDRYSAPVVGDDGTNYGRLWVFRDITERTERERELREFKQAVEQAGHAIYITDTDGTIEYVNPAFEDVTGYAAEEAIGETPEILSSGEYGADFYEDLWDTILAGQRWEREMVDERKDGEEVILDQTIAPIETDGGAVEGFVAVNRDVTERREREERLRIYEYACDSALSGIAIGSLDGELLSVNPAFVDMWGYEGEDELLGRSVTELWASPERATEVLNTVQETGSWDGELPAVRRDESTFFVHCSASYVTDDEGEPIALMSSFVDISERKEREQELAEEREKYATLVEQSHDGVAIIQDGEFVFVNPRLTEISGYEEAELLGMPFTDVIAPEERRLVQDRYERRVDSDADSPPSRYTMTFETKEGARRAAEVSAADIRYEGAPADLVSVRDITERQQYEAELERITEELEMLNRVVRHDIRNDMAVILGWAELLEDHVDDAGTDHLEKILTNGEHIVEITDIARDYVETLTSDEAVDVKPTRLRQVLKNEIALRREAYPDAEITVDDPIPDVDVRANEMLSSVFRNLLNNAVQHNDKDTPIVEVTAKEQEDDVRVTVADNGPGVPETQREAIFGKGEMGLESSGTGIGLYLVRTLVEQYDGDVWVEDNEPDGAEFTVTLPKAD